MTETNPYLIPSQITQINFLTNTEAVLKIQRAPHLNYFTQSIPIPGFSAPNLTVAGPHANVKLEGNKPFYDPLVITFKLDQDMKNYIELLGWLQGLAKPRGYEDQTVFAVNGTVDISKLSKYSDASVFILSNSKRPSFEVRYSKLFPVALSVVTFDTTNPDNTYAQCTASFQYDYFEVYRVSDAVRLA